LFAVPALAALLGAFALPAVDGELTSTDEAVVVSEEGGGSSFALASNCTYYNNAQHTQIVGQFGYDCCNNAVAWGKKTAFKVCGGCFICFPPPP
jgi:hypothetical protein